MKDYYKLSVDETLNELNADSAGLSSERAAERLAQYGPNKLKEAEKPGFWKRFLTQHSTPAAAHSSPSSKTKRFYGSADFFAPRKKSVEFFCALI